MDSIKQVENENSLLNNSDLSHLKENKEDKVNSLLEKVEPATQVAQKSLTFIAEEANHLEKELRRFVYKHPFVVMITALSVGYLSHWLLNKPVSPRKS